MLNAAQTDCSPPASSSIEELLCCPFSHRPLKNKGKHFESSEGRIYPLIESIPCFLPSSFLPLDLAEKGLKAFSRRGAGKSWALGHWKDLRLGELIGRAQSSQLLKALCIGGGPSDEKKALTHLGYETFSMDIDPMEGVDFLADAHHLPVRDESFDMVLAFEVLEHLHNPFTAIKEASRVLKDGGRFVGSVAFYKPFHSSYFHMTHWGLKSLLESANLRIERLYPGQNSLYHSMGSLLPLGPRKLSSQLYHWAFLTLMRLRRLAWSMKTKESDQEPLKRFDPFFQLSFKDYDHLRLAPTIVFSAVKSKREIS